MGKKTFARLLRRILVTVVIIGALYILPAPFILPRVYETRLGKILYTPILFSLEKDWFGRPVVWWYFWEVCKMKLLVPVEANERE